MPDEPACRFTCPFPPSTNHLFSSVAGRSGSAGARRAKSAIYKRWLVDAGWAIKAQTVPSITGAVRVLIEAPVSRRRDLDNMLKPLLDIMGSSKHGLRIIEDDQMVDDLRIVRSLDGDKVTVSIWPM